jgi:hypothetical protein
MSLIAYSIGIQKSGYGEQANILFVYNERKKSVALILRPFPLARKGSSISEIDHSLCC